MRRKALSAVLVLPAASALSLANFQLISSTSIPLSCQLTYDSQIPSCVQADFNNGCSAACVAGLNKVAGDVSGSCSGVSVNSNTLLGIVMSGNVVQALCPNGGKTTTTSAKVSATQANSVTIPTNSQGVTGGLGLKTTTTSPSVSKTHSVLTTHSTTSISSSSTSEASKTTSSKSESSTLQTSTAAPTTVPTAAPTTAVGAGETASSTSSEKTSKTTSTKSPASTAKSGDGGGSPFDISGAGQIETKSILTTAVVMFWAGILFGR